MLPPLPPNDRFSPLSRLSVSQTTTYRWHFVEDVARYAKAGIKRIGVWRTKLSDLPLEQASDLLDYYQVRASYLTWAGGFTGFDGRRFQECIDDGLDAVHAAARIGAECLIVHSGDRGGHTRNHAKRLFCDAIDELLSTADGLDVTLAIEPMRPDANIGMTFLAELTDVLDILEKFNDPRLKMVLDTYHLGDDPVLIQSLGELIDRIALVKLGDSRRKEKGEPDRCLLGDGCIPLQEIVDRLELSQYSGLYDVELLGESIEGISYALLLEHARSSFVELMETARLHNTPPRRRTGTCD